MGPSLGLNGGEAEADQAVKAGRNTQSVPPSSVLPASPEIAKATLKHLPGNSAKFRAIVLRVRDNGIGLPDRPQPRYGILGMRERAMLIGATLTIENHPEGGVEVKLSAPPQR